MAKTLGQKAAQYNAAARAGQVISYGDKTDEQSDRAYYEYLKRLRAVPRETEDTDNG